MQNNMAVSKLKCKVFRVRFNRDLFAICDYVTDEDIPSDAITSVDVPSGQQHFTALGDGLCTTPGHEVILSGSWEYSEKYECLQLRINDCYDHVGTSREEVVAYLSSKILKGIGKKTANSIYDMFGERSLDVIESDPKALLDVPGIKEKKLSKIVSSYEKNRALHSLSKLLSPFGISYKMVVRIHRRLGEGSAATIRSNPYCLCDIGGFGFKKADEIALKMGEFTRSAFRIEGAIAYVLRNAEMEDGHLYLSRRELLSLCCSDNVLNNRSAERISVEDVAPVLDGMIDRETVRVLVVSDDGGSAQDEQCIYLIDNFSYEVTAAEAITEKLQVGLEFQDWEAVVLEVQEEIGRQLDDMQLCGAIMALSSPISVITGGPGTGKTTGLRAIVESYKKVYPKKRIQLAAPTGRAARRMSEQTRMKAMTLHSLLRLTPDSHTNFYAVPNEDEMVRADLLVVDEASMIDAHLMAELMFRLRSWTQVLFLGDVEQLPSVGAGNVLRQLLCCELIPHVKLERIFRQEDGSVIPVNAAKIKNGEYDLIENKYFKIIRCKDEDEGAQVISELHKRCMKKGLIDSTQVLCPMRKRGATGTNQLNKLLQDIVNPRGFGKAEAEIGHNLFRVGDKVIQTRNIEGVSNGDIGYVRSIGGSSKDGDFLMEVFFESVGDIVEYSYEDALDLELAYAITIHKSQGSEFPAVIVPMFKNMGFFLCRNLLYTAVTRAKEQVVIVTDWEARGVAMAIGREDSSRRNTMLGGLVEGFPKQ